MIKLPEKLNPGDRVVIIPPAKSIDFRYVQEAVGILRKWQLDPVLSDNISSGYFQFAGNDEERLSSLQKALDDQSLKAVFCARGGYGTTRLIDKLDLDNFLKSPKWIIGYSDITALLNTLFNHSILGIHGPMPLNFMEENADASLIRLNDYLFNYTFNPLTFTTDSSNKTGLATGQIVGGNLTMICNCLATSSDLNTDQCILFLEDVDEYLYRIDRMLVQLKRAGKLKGLSALIIGHFTRMLDNDSPFGKTVREMVLELTDEYDYPVCFNAPIGHEMPNSTIPIGERMKLHVEKYQATLSVIR